MQHLSPQEQRLCGGLLEQPAEYSNRFDHAADCALRRRLFHHLAAENPAYLTYFFPSGPPADHSEPWSLRSAQGAVDGAEYSAAAKGTACGHIFKAGESTYHCKTCAADDTCVLCARCFDASDHDGHMVFISVSPGNSGCCDCGDREAWKREVPCTIHTVGVEPSSNGSGKEKVGGSGSDLPVDLVEAVRMTIARAVDYLCDVFSCSPEQLRLPKTDAGIRIDERSSRLSSVYGEEPLEDQTEYALILWNDEKHTVYDVQNQVARACQKSKKFGFEKAMEVNDIGRSVIHYSTDLSELLHMAEIIEQLKVTVTIRSSRDTFREQMCATIIDWIADISGCSVGNDPHLLREVVCEELLKPWRTGSQAANKDIGKEGIDDHELDENEKLRRQYRRMINPQQTGLAANIVRVDVEVDDTNDDDDDDDDDNEDEDEEYDDEMDLVDDGMEIEVEDLRAMANTIAATATDADMDIDFLDEDNDGNEAFEATLAGYPPPPPPPPQTGRRRQILTPQDSDEGEPEQSRASASEPYGNIPRTPKVKGALKKHLRPSQHWLQKPDGFRGPRPSEPCEDLWQRVRLDFLILYDLRLWKILRIHLRHLYITTVVTISRFKRILGLRFAGLYTALAQLYLIADREPDHSIINLSVQMLTTPTITQEVVERGNFLTNLMAILYTFLTTRQVGFPEDVSPRATLAFDAGAVTNRRMFHFFLDLRWLFQSEFIHQRMRVEPRYLLQYLDLVKLHQGVCPNLRATGEHVEYESDAWISASMIVKEVNKLCKQVAVSFEPKPELNDGNVNLQRAIRTVAQVTMINSFGYERRRFQTAEVKDDLAWHQVGPFEDSSKRYFVPKHTVQTEPMSFHHPLHYLLSWLIESGKAMTRDEIRALLHFAQDDLKDPWNAVPRTPSIPTNLNPDDLLSAIFEHPLRVCVWLAQMKAGMWVRNGITLRHQAHTYRSVSHRDVGYQRDILMVQTGLVLCGAPDELPGERFLAQMIDRFQMESWFKGDYSIVQGFEEAQQLDVIEDFFHLLVIVLCERGNLVPSQDGKEQHDKVLQHDIAHALCFKPLSFSDLASRVTEKVGESDDFQRVLDTMTNFRPPEGLNDTGTFELKPEYTELVDPYYAHYSRNHREEAENIYKKHMARKTGKNVEDVVYEPTLQSIPSGLFANLSAFTATPLFTQVVETALNYAANVKSLPTKVQVTRVETFLHMVLHLTLIATGEDAGRAEGFVKLAAVPQNFMRSTEQRSLVSTMVTLSAMEEYASCHATIKHILRKMQLQQPEKLTRIIGPLGAVLDRADAGSPASLSAEDKERKKQEAKARQARVMAQMKMQQNSFMANQGLSAFGDDLDDLDDMSVTEDAEGIEQRKTWNFPTGTCIWCQEETDDQKLYGTFAFLGESNILRSTPIDDIEFVKEVVETPSSLDRPADDIRPFGVAGKNKYTTQKVGADGNIVNIERQGLSKGFPQRACNVKGPVATSCGHIMHYTCFDLYMTNSYRRHTQQIVRNHPENIELKEFTCPLCKALGNAFIPIIWKAKECAQEHELHAAKDFKDWMAETDSRYPVDLSMFSDPALAREPLWMDLVTRCQRYIDSMVTPSIISGMNELSLDSPPPTQGSSQQAPSRRSSGGVGVALSRLFAFGRNSYTRDADGNPQYNVPVLEPMPRNGELLKAYTRIDETIRVNKLSPPPPAENSNAFANPVDTLSRSLGLSISAFEIAQRGQGSSVFSTSLLSDLPEQYLTHFRIMSETIESYIAVNVLRPSPIHPVHKESHKRGVLLNAQLFGGDNETDLLKVKILAGKLLFQDDIFLFFVDWLSFQAPTVAEASSIMSLLYWAEIAKAAFIIRKCIQQLDWTTLLKDQINQDQVSQNFKTAMNTVQEADMLDTQRQALLNYEQISLQRRLIEKYALAFLRKCIVVMFVRYGLDFECPYNIDPESPELDRLTKLLHMPTIDEICETYISQSPSGEKLRKLTKDWIAQANVVRTLEHASYLPIKLPHPAIFELVGLPKTYDALTEEAIKRKCPTTGKEITDPAVCLLCGAIFCSQAVCCMKEKNKGGCYQHMKGCGSKIGIFINIRKCMVLFTHGPGNGSYAHAPYLDKHGEPDPTLRRHHQLFLNQRRYDKLMREVWLGHQIPTVISRKLEADINTGGWETL